MNKPITSLLMIVLASSPVAASVRDAAFSSSGDPSRAQTSMYAGATYRIDFDRRAREPRGRATLKLSGMAYRPGTSEIGFGEGIEITANGSGKPALLVGGADLGKLRRSAGLSGSATAALFIVGVALVAGGIFLATRCDNDCDNANAE